MKIYSVLIFATFAVKIGFLIFLFYLKYLKEKEPKNLQKQAFVSNSKDQLDFVFIFLMSAILIINFHPYVEYIQIDKETKTLFFLYGIIMILTANYTNFENNSILLNDAKIGHDLSSNTFPLFNSNGDLQTFQRN